MKQNRLPFKLRKKTQCFILKKMSAAYLYNLLSISITFRMFCVERNQKYTSDRNRKAQWTEHCQICVKSQSSCFIVVLTLRKALHLSEPQFLHQKKTIGTIAPCRVYIREHNECKVPSTVSSLLACNK